MNNDADVLEIRCGSCNKKFVETVGWLKTQPTNTFRCPKCGAAIKYDTLEYMRLISEQASDGISQITLHPTDETS